MGTIYRNGVPFVGSGGAGGVEMTQAEYDDLPTSEKMNGAIYFITDGDVSYPSASQMRYDNTESQIPATTVQGAIDENRIEINDLKTGLSDGDSTYVKLPDGTMITHTAHTGIKSGDRITYPQQFVGQPHIFFSTNYNTATTIKCIFTASSASNTGFDIYAWDTSTNAVSTSTTLSVNVLAIGRWK